MAPLRLEADRVKGEDLSFDPVLVGKGENAVDGSIPLATSRTKLLVRFMIDVFICYQYVVLRSITIKLFSTVCSMYSYQVCKQKGRKRIDV